MKLYTARAQRDMLLNSPSAFFDTAASTQNVFLATRIGEIIELRWEVGDTITLYPPGWGRR
jgi:hypothetical protein